MTQSEIMTARKLTDSRSLYDATPMLIGTVEQLADWCQQHEDCEFLPDDLTTGSAWGHVRAGSEVWPLCPANW